jgi:cell division protein ZapE
VTTHTQSIAARLREQVAAQRLEFDASQQDAAMRLDELRASLLQQSRSIGQKLRARLRWLPLASTDTPLRGLYLWGGVGRGKTMLMDLFYESLRPAHAERTHFHRFMRQIHAQLRRIKKRSDPLDAVAEKWAARMRVICLDELFVADIGDAMLLEALFDGLFRRGVTLVATSNVPPQELYKEGLQRQRFVPAIELMQTHMQILHLDGGIDYRLRQLEQAPTYFDSRLPGTAAQLKARFAALAGGSAAGPTMLSVEDRPIRALATGAGMVWFEFSDICEGPRSQNDYIELARLYHTIFIANIPVFTRSNENAARRFISVIDEFYDRNVNIVVSAAAAPGELYHGEQLRLEFLRAASRLIEMQTQQYLAGCHRP